LTGAAQAAAKSVLVVDDDDDIRECILEVLQHNGYTVSAAVNGEEALRQLRSSARLPCLILLDLMMPVMDGWRFRSAQIGDPRLESIPVIVLTAHGSAEQAAAEMKTAGLLDKPLKLDTLLEVVRRHCGCA
jgi:CheY-like chemotaxis protein